MTDLRERSGGDVERVAIAMYEQWMAEPWERASPEHKHRYKRHAEDAIAALAQAGNVAGDVGLPDPDPSALIVRLVQLSKPPYDSGIFGGPMAKAAAMLTTQAETIMRLRRGQ